jgi:cation transport regulator ChaC
MTMIIYTFGYGSLLNPDSLRSTLPGTVVEGLIPARVHGYRRTWNVAFPNDGSQPDKAYLDVNERRPPFVLFSNINPHPMATDTNAVNGVLIPVTQPELTNLKKRELRYSLIEITSSVELYDRQLRLRDDARVLAFSGREVFSHPSDVERGCIPQRYIKTILEGVSFWDKKCAGFAQDFHASTTTTKAKKIVDLRRVKGQAKRSGKNSFG